jgi:hypothetical protein
MKGNEKRKSERRIGNGKGWAVHTGLKELITSEYVKLRCRRNIPIQSALVKTFFIIYSFYRYPYKERSETT